MTILITGVAGFIGSHIAKHLLGHQEEIIGLDNLNHYYDVSLKHSRLKQILNNAHFKFEKIDITDREVLPTLFKKYNFSLVIHMAAQPGVRYSLECPESYIDNNLVGFANILECCRHAKIPHLIYASSSSVYGNNKKLPYHEEDKVEEPLSLYAATKKSNELMAYCYAHLYQLPCIGLRFFTVYGPWTRPDMALYKFTQNIFADKPIEVYNQGQMQRDFTYIDDIVNAIIHIAKAPTKAYQSQKIPYRIYNLGNSQPTQLLDFIHAIEKAIGKEAIKNYLPMQPGDMQQTYADVMQFTRDYGYSINTPLEQGVNAFVDWFRDYYQL